MKILEKMIGVNSELAAKVIELLDGLTCDYKASFSDGWSFAIEMQAAGKTDPFFRLVAQDERGGGDLAPIKMQTLRIFPGVAATGFMSVSDLSSRLTQMVKNQVGNLPAIAPEDAGKLRSFLDRIHTLETIAQITDEDLQCLHNVGITTYQGAIRVPYTMYRLAETDGCLAQGDIRIAFSGAKEWQDLMLAALILQSLQRNLRQLWKSEHIHYDLTRLNQLPEVAMAISLAGVETVPI